MRQHHLLGHAIVTAILLAAVATLAISLLVSRVTRPRSGERTPASVVSSVVFASPLRPTTPIASPSASPRDIGSSNVRVP